MTRKVLGLMLAFGFLSVSATMAEEVGPGCGLGKTLFEGQKGITTHTLAATTNATSGSQTFGITSGTSGCDADQVILKEKEQAMFVALNMDNLSQEMAQGDGQYLQSLAGLMGCSSTAYSEFASMTQHKFSALMGSADTDSAQLLAGLKREMAAHPTLSASCSRIAS